jgi:hypothetical protein
LLAASAHAGTVAPDTSKPTPVATTSGFESARRPISNPTLFDLALPTTNIHPIYIHHALPDRINTTAGNLPLGGDVQVFALQFEYALSERLSIVATKDGYVDVSPDSTLSNQEGFANLGAGVKYAFLIDPVNQTAVSGSLTFEVPTGNSDVFQGEGDGLANLIVSGLKLQDRWQFAGGAGLQVPFNDDQSLNSWISTHASYEVCNYFIPLVELNWFHVLDEGDGAKRFSSQADGDVPGVVQFEGGDFFNLGASHADDNADLVTAAAGFRSRLTQQVDVGAAYEFPLTGESDSLMDHRITVDLNWKF